MDIELADARGLHPALSDPALLDALAAAMLLGADTRDDADCCGTCPP